MQCLACKNKNSIERCSKKTLKNLKFCGVHVRSKHKKFWTSIHDLDTKVTKVQALFRGWLVRDTLRLCGPGVLKKEERHNEDDLVTADQAYPLEYFGILENGKVFWFDVRTIYQWTTQHLEPTNPYTKQFLTIDDRKRLKKIVARRERFDLSIYHDLDYFKNCDQVKYLFYQIIQILNENLFAEIPESYFFELNEYNIIDLASNLTESCIDWKKSKNPILKMYFLSLDYTRILLESYFFGGLIPFLITVLGILKYNKIQYEFSFKFMAARSNLI